MQLLFLRHGATKGNLERRYLGRTDEPLCVAGRVGISALGQALKKQRWLPDKLIVSPYRRCAETAEILFPGILAKAVGDLGECDFGAFEYKTHGELEGTAAYQNWLESGGALPFPGGEGKASFCKRSCRAFSREIGELLAANCGRAAFVVHGGTIMAVLERYGLPQKGYFDWQVANGAGYWATLCPESWKREEKFAVQGEIAPCGK